MPASLETNGTILRIILTGKFDFSVHDDFRQIISQALANETAKEIQVNMAELVFMDSSGISLLLLLNEKASLQGKTVVLTNCRDQIKEIFSIGGFDNILTIR